MIRIALVLVFILIHWGSKANINIDSLEQLLSNPKEKIETRLKAGKSLAIHYLVTDSKSGLRVTNEAIKLASNSKKYKPDLAYFLHLKATVYYITDDFPNALKNYFLAQKMYYAAGDSSGAYSVNSDLANVYDAVGEYTKAVELLEDFNQYQKERGNKRVLALGLVNLSGAYQEQGQLDKAFKKAQESLKLYDELKDSEGIAYSNSAIGSIYMEMGQFNEARTPLQSSFEWFELKNDLYGMAPVLFLLGQLEIKQHRIDEGINKCTRALTYSEQLGSISDQKDCFDCLYQAWKEKGNLNKALYFKERYIKLYEQLINEEKFNEIAFMRAQNHYEKKHIADSVSFQNREKIRLGEISTLNAEKEAESERRKSQGVILLGIILILILTVVFAFLIFNRLRLIRKQNKIIEEEKERSEGLLRNILPDLIVDELKSTGESKPRKHTSVTVMFTDFSGFTQFSEYMTPEELVYEINVCFSTFDKIVEKYGVEKIKTIGDSYMCAAGFEGNGKTNAINIIKAAQEINEFIIERKHMLESKGDKGFELRIGVHTGPVIAGVVGLKKFAYDIWGDTVNMASRMESSGEVGKINISSNTYSLVKGVFTCFHRGKVKVKNKKGSFDMYFVG